MSVSDRVAASIAIAALKDVAVVSEQNKLVLDRSELRCDCSIFRTNLESQ